ncbi:MAG: Coenzyme F420 hydrogenase/dehydrogenase, beta subunit C-terminal domain [Syntrophomonas sp.]|nr:Coenzyme F420 hydrogenase/dehydrogenase, beta subunit C-terminal domain [Syntrophomonas sp.]
MDIYQDKNRCSGCTACLSACPLNAISMVADNKGYKYPQIDMTRCKECRLCQTVCQLYDSYSKKGKLQYLSLYVAKHKNEEVRTASSSNGIFAALTSYILNKNGVIYGAAIDEQRRISHQKAESVIEKDKFRVSEHYQSDLGSIFRDVKAKLDQNRYVLFTGTACQNLGLKAYLENKKYEKLILCDLVCQHKALRPSCRTCVFKDITGPSDITIDDFWGVETSKPDNFYNLGVILVLINTEQGEAVFKGIKNHLVYEASCISK